LGAKLSAPTVNVDVGLLKVRPKIFWLPPVSRPFPFLLNLDAFSAVERVRR